MVFGLCYGSVFGVEHLLPALWLRPLDDIDPLHGDDGGARRGPGERGLLLNAVNAWRAASGSGALLGTRGLLGAFLYSGGAGDDRQAGPAAAVDSAHLGRSSPSPAARPRSSPPANPRPRPLPPTPAPRRRARPTRGRAGSALVGSVEVVDALFSFFTRSSPWSAWRPSPPCTRSSVALFALTDALGRARHGGGVRGGCSPSSSATPLTSCSRG